MNENTTMIQPLTASAIVAESASSIAKHGLEHSPINPAVSRGEKLAMLVEEVGEVAHLLTYDTEFSRYEIIKELIQVANVAAMWAESEEGLGE